MRRDNTIGEWQEERNIWGGVRRYRMVNGAKEYELEIRTASGAVISQSQLEKHNQRNAAAEYGSESAQPSRDCPFRSNSLETKCLAECAFYTAAGCVLAATDIQNIPDTKDRRCPIAARYCTDSCAMYNSGCTLIQNMIRKEKNT